MDMSLLMHFSVDGHLDCIHILTIVNSPVKNFGTHVFFELDFSFFFFLSIEPGVELLDHMVVLFLVF